MSMNDDFGKHRGAVGDDRSTTAEDATLKGTPIEEQPGLGEDPTLPAGGANDDEAALRDPSRLDSDTGS